MAMAYANSKGKLTMLGPIVLLIQSLVSWETGSGITYSSFLHATIEASIMITKKEN
jgi:hypothetical protein